MENDRISPGTERGISESDEALLTAFFNDNRQEIEDNGFSKAVIRQLPNRNQRLAWIWTTACWVVGIVMFFLLDGVGALQKAAQTVGGQIMERIFAIDIPLKLPVIIIISAGILAWVIVANLFFFDRQEINRFEV